MVVISVFSLLIIFESSKVVSNAFNTYCSLPCPFTGPAQPPCSCSCGAIQLPPRRQRPIARSTVYDAYTDYDEIPEESQLQPQLRSRQQSAKPDPPPPASRPPKPKTKPPPEAPEPPPKKRSSLPAASSPYIQPSRRFFTSLFSIPGAVVDTMIGGEVTL